MKTKICMAFTLSFLSLPLLATDYYLIKNETTAADYSSLDGRGSNNGSFSGWATTATGTTKVQFNGSYGAVDPDGDYHLNNKLIRAKPNESTTGYTFAGRTLIFDGTSPAVNSKITTKNSSKVFTIGRLVVTSGTTGEFRQGNDGTGYLAGTNWVVESGATLSFNTSEENNASKIRNWDCAATITGEGVLLASAGIYDEARGVMKTEIPTGGTITYSGDLSRFAGYLNAGGFGQTHYSGWAESNIKAKITTSISKSLAFPQATPNNSLLERSIVVTDGATLSFSCDVTSPTTRGWDFGDGAVPTVYVADGKTVRINGPVKGSVGLNKTGGGTLILNVGGEGNYDVINLNGSTTMSAEDLSQYVVKCDTYINESIPTLVDLSLAVNGGTSVKVSSSISYLSLEEGASATLKILYGTAADALTGIVTATSLVTADGTVPVTVKGLSRGTAYYFKAVLELPGGSTVESDVLSATTITDYTTAMRRIEYIESTGTQYIDSWYYPGINTHIRADFQFVVAKKDYRLFGLNVGGIYFHAYINANGNFGYQRADNGSSWKSVGSGTKVGTVRYLHDFNCIDSESQHAYRIYGPDGSAVATQSPMEGSITKTASVPLTIGATRNATTGGVKDGETAELHRIYSMLFDEGDALTAALAPVVRSSDDAVGLYDSVRNMFLPSESVASYVAGPTISTVERFNGASQVAVDLTFLGAPMARDLRIAYGPGFGGDNPADWGTTELVATIPAGATFWSVPLPANWGSEDVCVLRCYFDDGTTFPLWSDAVVYREASEPIITGVTVDGTGGDSLVVHGALGYFPGDDCTLSVRVTKGNGSPVVWSNLTNVTESGNFELTLLESDTTAERYIEPGATYSVVVEAVSGETSGSSLPVVATAKGAPVFASSSSTVSRRTVTFTGNLADLGANTNATVTLYVGTQNNANKLAPVETPVTRTATGSFDISHIFADFEKTYYWQLCAVCTTAGGRTLETRTDVASCKTLDATIYTWQAVNGEWSGDWSDPDHWANDKNGDCLGYPQSSAATASFLSCTHANPVTVNVNGKYTVKKINFFDAEPADLSFVGTGTNTSSLTTIDENTIVNEYMQDGSRLLVKDLKFNGNNKELKLAQKESNTATNVAVVFSGAAVENVKALWFRVNESSLTFCDGSTVVLTEKLSVGGTNTVITIDNSTVTTPSVYAGDNRASSGLKLCFVGADPSLAVSVNFQTYNRADTICLEFAVPVGGYASAPLVKTGSAFATAIDKKTPGYFKFAVSEDSPALKRSREVLSNVVIVQTEKGFETACVGDGNGGIGDGQEGVPGWAFKWGVNGTATSDTTAARQILLDLQGYGKPPMMFLVY